MLRPALLLAACAAAGTVQAHDYPTTDRVAYVLECMRQHPGSSFEMISKCSCTVDKLAQQVPIDEFVTMTTATNANSIGGERGNVIRDTEMLQKQIRRFRDLQSKAKKACFIQSEPQR